MTRILFADEDQDTLSGLRRMLRPLSGEWDMAFAADGETAQTLLGTERFDIVISDLRLADMDGLDFLQVVQQRSPESVRIALSAESDKEATLKAVSQVHQFVPKPCDLEELQRTVDRAAALGRLLANEDLKRLMGRMEALPSLGAVLDDIVSKLEAPDVSVADVGGLIAHDPGLSAKVLQVVNSALFGLRSLVSDPIHAAALLGLDALKALVLSVRVFEAFSGERADNAVQSRLWEHCLLVARLAKRVCLEHECDTPGADAAFLAGLLHDTGKLVLLANFRDAYRPFVTMDGPMPTEAVEAERQRFGATHGQVGAYLIGLWGFAEPLVEAIAYHNEPRSGCARRFAPLTAVHVANAMAHSPDSLADGVTVDGEYLAELGLADHLPRWREMRSEVLRENEA